MTLSLFAHISGWPLFSCFVVVFVLGFFYILSRRAIWYLYIDINLS
jgi:hypothetical protein